MRLPFLIQPGQLPGQFDVVRPAGQASQFSPQNVLPAENPYESAALIFGAAAVIGFAVLVSRLDKVQRAERARMPARPYPYAV
jgi:hypothetical protein